MLEKKVNGEASSFPKHEDDQDTDQHQLNDICEDSNKMINNTNRSGSICLKRKRKGGSSYHSSEDNIEEESDFDDIPIIVGATSDDSAFEDSASSDDKKGGGGGGRSKKPIGQSLDETVENDQEQEQVMFEFEVSPKDGQIMVPKEAENVHVLDENTAGLNRTNSKGRRVHYNDHSEDDVERHRSYEQLETILLPPPMEEDVATEFGEQGSIKRQDESNNTLDTSPKKKSGEYEVVYIVPDGGWGWLVLFGSIIVNILIPGMVKSFGILFVEFLEVFDASPAAAAWIPALSYWLYSSMGPFAGALAIKYSHRSVTIVGGLLASSGLMLSYFATSIPFLYISYGIIGGLGSGLAYPIGVFMVGQYFDKRRGLANGLCTSGSALGSVLIPPLLRFLLNEYGYRWAILIMGCLLLNVCLAAFFYEPVDKHMKMDLVLKCAKTEDDEENGEKDKNEVLKVMETKQEPVPIPCALAPGPGREVAASMPIAIPFLELSRRNASGSGRKATFQIGHEDESWSYRSNEVASPLAARLIKEENASSPIKSRHLVNDATNAELESLVPSSGLPPTHSSTATSLTGMNRLNLEAIPEDMDDAGGSQSPTRKMDWQYFKSLTPAKQRLLRMSLTGSQQSSGGLRSAHPSSAALQPGLSRTLSMASNVSTSSFRYMTSTIHHGTTLTAIQYDKNLPEFASTLTMKSMKDTCCPTVKRLVTCGPCLRKGRPSDARDSKQKSFGTEKLKKFIDLSLLKDGIYIIMLLSNCTSAVGYTNFIVLLPAYAKELKFDKDVAAYLLSIVAAFDFVGRIGGAALSDMQFVSRKWYYILGLLFSGIALALIPTADTYSSLLLLCGVFGLASGVYIGVTAVILADQLGAEKLGSSYGISLFLNGLLQLAGPPICGAIFQSTNKHEPILTGLGITLILGSCFWIFAPCIESRRKRKLKKHFKETQSIDNDDMIHSDSSVV